MYSSVYLYKIQIKKSFVVIMNSLCIYDHKRTNDCSWRKASHFSHKGKTIWLLSSSKNGREDTFPAWDEQRDCMFLIWKGGDDVNGGGVSLLLINSPLFSRTFLVGGLCMPRGFFKNKPAISSPEYKVEKTKQLRKKRRSAVINTKQLIQSSWALM